MGSAIAALGLCGLILVLILIRFEPARRRADGWQLGSGRLCPAGQAQALPSGGTVSPGEYTAKEGVKLSSGSILLEVEKASAFLIAPGRGLPRVLSGRIHVRASEALELGRLEAIPLEEVQLTLEPGGFVVMEGRVRIGGDVLEKGARWALEDRGEEGAVGEASPGSATEASTGEPPRYPAGRALDAATGLGISGARVLAVFFHGAQVRGTDRLDAALGEEAFLASAGVPGAATYPPLHMEATETEEDGSFSLPLLAPEDPRLSVFVQIDHPLYAPEAEALAGRDRIDGRWAEREIRLRKAASVRVEIVDPDGKPLARAPVAVTGRREGFDFLGPEEPSLSGIGRIVKRDPPRLLFTGDDGALRLAYADSAYDLELLHPFYHLYLREPNLEMLGLLTIRLPLEGALRLGARPGLLEQHLLVDLDGAPIESAEVEVALEGMPPLRLLSDEAGWVRLGLWPYPFGEPPLSYSRPRQGSLTVLTTGLFKRGAAVSFPSLEKGVVVEGRPAGRLAFRTVTGEAGASKAILPDGVETSLDLTLSSRSADGEVEFRGALPEPGVEFEISLSGYLPARVVAPARARSATEVDLGEVFFSPGWSREVVLSGGGPDSYRGTRLHVSPAGGLPFEQTYWPPDAGRVTVGGLLEGVYTFGVEGPRIRTYSGAFEIVESELDTPIEIPLTLSDEEDVVLSGRVIELPPLDATRSEVVESYFLAGVAEPLTFPPYKLSPDGVFGSLRRLRAVTGVRVAITSHLELGAEAILARLEGPPIFLAGDLRLRPQPHAEISFHVEGLGRVAPPLRAELRGEEGLEKLARLRVKRRKLFLDNLRPGNYSLRWLGARGEEEVFGFRVPNGTLSRIEGTAFRSPLPEETIEVLVTDQHGRPIEAAAIFPRAESSDLEVDEPGVGLATLEPGKKTVFEVKAPGYLDAHVEVEAGGTVPNHISLYPPAAAAAVLLDESGGRLDGTVTISWEPLTPSPITHGSPRTVLVERGELRAGDLPPLPLLFTLRLSRSDLAIRREWTLPDPSVTRGRECDLGVLRFEETRTLRGAVRLPDGSPALEGVVALVPPKDAYRFPLKEGGTARARYSTKCDAQGVFLLDGLPLDLSPDLVLVAHQAGLGDDVEDPVDWASPSHDLTLTPAASLHIDVGYRDGVVRDAFGFWLEYWRDPADKDSGVQLGEVVPQLFGGRRYEAVEPGHYRLKWGLREPYEPVPALFQEADVVPGLETRIALRLEGRALGGKARINGAPVKRGWILLTDHPGPSGQTTVGRIVDGEFLLLDPPDSFRAYAAVVPEGKPQPLQNIARGEALPAPVRNYRAVLRDGLLQFDYVAHDLTLRLGDGFLARHQGAVVSFEHYEWDRSRFRAYPDEELIESPTVEWHLLSPGPQRITVRSAKGSLIFTESLDLREDRVVELR
jgi:hypothetical protein